MPGAINGVAGQYLIHTGGNGHRGAPCPRAAASRGPAFEIVEASDVTPGRLAMLDEVSIGPLSPRRVRGDVSNHSIGDQLLLGTRILQHFELSQRRRDSTLRAPRASERRLKRSRARAGGESESRAR